MYRNLLGKIIISGTLECLTGMHIGASRENMEIGAIDSPVVRDPVTREPYIPGSSLKGKMRALLEKALATIPNRPIGSDVKIHVCNNAETAIKCEVCRVFGATGKKENDKEGSNFPARLIVRDLYLTRDSMARLSDIDTGLQYTEWKFENAIDRVTSAANPRQIERVPKGAKFELELIYNVEDAAHIVDDMKHIKLAIELIKMDAVGGHGSRGYGKVDVKYGNITGKTIAFLKDNTIGQQATATTLDNVEGIVSIFNGDKK
ncbi:MAG: type III-A CRISPR-associated RAMP protein Csm3 [Nitrospirae bacterium]|nr:type III-A CRISPR-associated RAMP protein Csm3 [Nitrospirota bacterium]